MVLGFSDDESTRAAIKTAFLCRNPFVHRALNFFGYWVNGRSQRLSFIVHTFRILEGESIRAAVKLKQFVCRQSILFFGQTSIFSSYCFADFLETRGKPYFFLTVPDSFSPH